MLYFLPAEHTGRKPRKKISVGGMVLLSVAMLVICFSPVLFYAGALYFGTN